MWVGVVRHPQRFSFFLDEPFALVRTEYKSCSKVLVNFVYRFFSEIPPDTFAGIGFRRPFEFQNLLPAFRIDTVELVTKHIKDHIPSTFHFNLALLHPR